MAFARSVLFFVTAGLCEIGGGYLVWLWLREGRAVWIGALGGLVLFLYGVLPTLQPPEAQFGRVYAAYGGVFVALSLAWGWWVDGARPDRWNLLGGAIALVGVLVGWAAITFDPAKATGLDGALRTVLDAPFGKWLLSLVALGIAAYGVFCFFRARYPQRT